MTSSAGRVIEIWRYPVKSMLGERLDAVALTPRGVEHDRELAVADPASGSVISAKRTAALFGFRARHVQLDPPVRVEAPDGAVLPAPSVELDRRLSAALGRTVTIVAQDGGRRPHIEMAASSATTEGPSTHFDGASGTFFDSAPIHLLTTATLTTFSGLVAGADFDARRFRPNLVVDGGGDGFVEERWVGRRVAVGDAVLQILKPCSRCVMVTHAQAELAGDRRVLGAVARHNDAHAGVLAEVERPGRVRSGADVVLL